MHRFRSRRFVPAVAAVGLLLLLLALVPATVGAASPYPPNTVVSNSFDPRFCGDGRVSVVSDQGGNLVDVCTATGQRIDPSAYAVPGYNYGSAPVYNSGAVPPITSGFLPTVNNGYTNAIYGPAGNGSVIRQYNDGNSNCPNGDVTQTFSGFFCTATGQPAASSLSFNSGYAPYTPYAPAYGGNGAFGTVGSGTVIRQYNDGNSNCPNGDVTQTLSGFFCTANGAPALRVR